MSENSFTESSNRSLQHDPLGPKPNDSIHIACDKTLAHTKETLRKRGSEAHDIAEKKQRRPKNRQETTLEVNTRDLSTDIDLSCIDLANKEFLLAPKYRASQPISRSSGLVPSLEVHVKFGGDYAPPDEAERHCRPVYRRTRKVIVTQALIYPGQLESMPWLHLTDDASDPFFTSTLVVSLDVNPVSMSLAPGDTFTLSVERVREMKSKDEKCLRSSRLHASFQLLKNQVVCPQTEAKFNEIVKEGHRQLVALNREKTSNATVLHP